MATKNNNSHEGFLGRVSLRTKIIIFIILTLIVAGIAYKAAVNNKGDGKNIVEKVDGVTNNSKDNKQSFIKESDKENNNSEEMKRLQEKSEKLEEMYEESYKIFGEKRYEDTIKLADQMIREDINFYKAYNIKGIAQCYSNNFSEGMKNIDKSLEIKPDFGYGRFNKALAYELYGYYEDSLKWYDKALEVEEYVWSYYGKASIYGRRGDIENTIKYLKIAIDIAPEIKEIAKEESDFNPVKSSKEFEELVK